MDERTSQASGLVTAGGFVLAIEAGLFILFEGVRELYFTGSYIFMAAYSLPMLLMLVGLFIYVSAFSQNREKEQLIYRTIGFVLMLYWLVDAVRAGLKPTILPFWAFVAGAAFIIRSFWTPKV